MQKLLNLWIFIPLLSGMSSIVTAPKLQNPTAAVSNAETFNQLVYVATSIILTIILAYIQRNFNKRVDKVEAVSVPKKDHDELEEKITRLENELALTTIQKQQLAIAEEQNKITRAILELLTESKGREAAILDTQTRMSNNIVSVGTQIDNLTDITIASADVSNSNLETLLTWLAQSEAKLIAAIEKRKTSSDSQPLTPVITSELKTTPIDQLPKAG